MQGMLYDMDNRPVCGYELMLDQKIRVFTDINGRFEFPSVTYKTHTLTGHGNGYIEINRPYDFSDRNQILYLRIRSTENLYCQLDKQLGKEQNADAAETLRVLSKTEKSKLKYKLYESLYRYISSETSDKSLLTTEIKELENKLKFETKKKTGAE